MKFVIHTDYKSKYDFIISPEIIRLQKLINAYIDKKIIQVQKLQEWIDVNPSDDINIDISNVYMFRIKPEPSYRAFTEDDDLIKLLLGKFVKSQSENDIPGNMYMVIGYENGLVILAGTTKYYSLTELFLSSLFLDGSPVGVLVE